MNRHPEDDATLLVMKEAGKTNRQIADALGLSEGAVVKRYGRLRSEARGNRKGERWSDDENGALIEAGDKGEPWGDIGARIKRTDRACKVQYNLLKRTAAGAVPKAPHQRIIRQSATELAKQIRDTSPQHRSITAEFFGDPLPGRSALDQRAGQGDGVRSVSLATGPMS
jgi:DNA-binding Lrp family transcriptional regulator